MFIVFNQLDQSGSTLILDLYPCIIMYIEIRFGLGSSIRLNVWWSIRCAISLIANYQMTELLLQVTTSVKCLSPTYNRLQSRGAEIPVIIVSDWYTPRHVNKRCFYSLNPYCTILIGISTPRLCNLFAVRERHFTDEVTYDGPHTQSDARAPIRF